ncbi:MAG: antitoxin family protein [Candidatus Sumerlaeota bacterium]|nr:antitoxin family protein [Candidatus Sumerlaeota bacterium]
MNATLKAVYHEGKLFPSHSLDIPDGEEVEITVDEPRLIPPSIASIEERRRMLHSIVERMRANPIPLNAPHFTRDQLHE